MKRILILSGSRADWAYLQPIAKAFEGRAECTVEQLWTVIEGEDTPRAITERAGLILRAGGGVIEAHKPDLMLVCGDRWEIAAASLAATLAGVPIAHLGAGETTLGAYDEQFRGVIEAQAALKFPMTQQAYCKIRGDGYLTGCTSVTQQPEIRPGDGSAVLILHPETRGALPAEAAYLAAREYLKRGGVVIRFGANPDVGSERFSEFKYATHPEDFHDRLARASLIIGNSSAGIIEAPILGTPTVNIGRRQEGRPRCESIFDCEPTAESIGAAIDKALAFGKRRVESPYYKPDAVEVVVEKCLE